MKTVYFYNIISNKSFYALPPDEYNKTYSDEELKCAVPKENGNGLNKYFPKVPKKARLEVDVVHVEDLDVTTTPQILPTPTIHPDTEVKFAIHETFHQSDLRYKLRPDLLKKCIDYISY
jgi:hypothetical protein